MKISASVYSNISRPLDELVKELDGYHVDYFHIDCNDDLSVFEDIRKIRSISKTPVDLHIISPHPEKFFDGIRQTGTEMVSFQFENLTGPLDIPAGITSKIGLAIVSGTPPESFSRLKNQFDFVLFMTTTPGKSGGKFNRENFRRIRQFQSLFPGAKIHVDGGVNDEISFVLRNMGVSLVVSGSYLVNADYMGIALHRLRSETGSDHILAGDFMIDKNECPVLETGKFSFRDVLQSIEKYNMGFTTVTGRKGELEGIITNADVRRGLLRHTGDLNKIEASALVNRSPVKVTQGQSVSEIIQMIKRLSFPVLFIPVVDDDNIFTGTLTFNNLIKGES